MQIARLLVKLTHSLSPKDLNLYISGELRLKCNPLNIKGKVKWDCDIKPISSPPDVNISNLKLANKRTLNFNGIQHGVPLFACPKCEHKEPCNIPQFQLNDLDDKLKCAQCLKATSVRYWNCPCLKQWHMCALHGYIDACCNQIKVKKIKKVANRPEVKNTTYPSVENKIDEEYAHLLSGDLRIERKRKATWNDDAEVMVTELTLGEVIHHDIPSNFLGPILKKRFKRSMPL